MKRVLVTGASGFIGSHLCAYLLERGYEVKGMVRKTSNLRWLEGLKLNLVYGDLGDEDSLEEAVKGVEAVFHTAAVVRSRKGRDFVRINYLGTKTLAEKAAGANVKKFILFSSVAAAGPVRRGEVLEEKMEPKPVSDYGRAKLLAEKAVLDFKEKMGVVILRFPAVYGPRDKDGLLFWRALKKGWAPVMGGTFSLIYVLDAVKAAVLAMESDVPSGSVYFISDGNCYTFEHIAREWERITKRGLRLVRVPFFLGFVAAWCNSWLKREGTIFNPDKVKELCQECWVCSDRKARLDLRFEPEYDLSRGGEITINWYKEKGWL